MAQWLDYQTQRLRAPCPENCRPHAPSSRLHRLKSISIAFLVVHGTFNYPFITVPDPMSRCFSCRDTSKSVATFATAATPLLRLLPPLSATDLTLSTSDKSQA